jgi:hypothetical protein
VRQSERPDSIGRRQLILGSSALLVLAGDARVLAEAPVPVDWVNLSIGSLLTLAAPPGTRFEPGRGADSLVGTLVGPNFKLQLDYGVYSDPLTDQSRFMTYWAEKILVDNKPATIVHATVASPSTDPARFIGLHVPQLGKSGLGALSLTLSSVVSDSEQQGILDRMFGSIHFTLR